MTSLSWIGRNQARFLAWHPHPVAAHTIRPTSAFCGPPPMCDTFSLNLAAKGLQEGRAFPDRFYSAVDSAATATPHVQGSSYCKQRDSCYE